MFTLDLKTAHDLYFPGNVFDINNEQEVEKKLTPIVSILGKCTFVYPSAYEITQNDSLKSQADKIKLKAASNAASLKTLNIVATAAANCLNKKTLNSTEKVTAAFNFIELSSLYGVIQYQANQERSKMLMEPIAANSLARIQRMRRSMIIKNLNRNTTEGDLYLLKTHTIDLMTSSMRGTESEFFLRAAERAIDILSKYPEK
jgi:hypothetical protein